MFWGDRKLRSLDSCSLPVPAALDGSGVQSHCSASDSEPRRGAGRSVCEGTTLIGCEVCDVTLLLSLLLLLLLLLEDEDVAVVEGSTCSRKLAQVDVVALAAPPTIGQSNRQSICHREKHA